MTARRTFAGVALAVAMAAATACGVPTGGSPATIAASDVPYGLASPSPTETAETKTEPVADPSRVFLVAPDDALVPRGREMTGAGSEARLGDLLESLAAGPTGEERDEQLSTALPPDVELTVTEVTDRIAVVDIGGIVDSPTGWATRRAVAQLVLTATSVPGIDAVRLTFAGDPVEAPLPGGQLTSAPLTAEDYAPFLVPAPRTTGPAPPAPPSAGPAPAAEPATPTS